MRAADVDEAAAMRDHIAELVWPVKGRGQGACAAGTEPADHPAGRVVCQVDVLPDNREQLLDQEPGVVAVDRVLLDAAVASATIDGIPGAHLSRCYEQPGSHRDLAAMD